MQLSMQFQTHRKVRIKMRKILKPRLKKI